jgi:hypothetical protein
VGARARQPIPIVGFELDGLVLARPPPDIRRKADRGFAPLHQDERASSSTFRLSRLPQDGRSFSNEGHSQDHRAVSDGLGMV